MSNSKKPSKNRYSHKVSGNIIVLGKIFQSISTDLATRFTAKIFATPVKFPVPEREMMMRDSAKKEMIKVPGIDRDVQVYEYGYSKRKVLLVHGWAGRGTQLYQIADKVLENRMMVIGFDGPAHGLSSGKRTDMIEFLQTIDEINKKYGPFEAAVGHSFGAMTLINAVAGGLPLEKLVIIGADNSIPEVFQLFIKKMKLKPVIGDKLVKLFEKKHRLRPDDLNSERKAEKIDIPTLVIHDSDDKIVGVSSAVSIRQKLKYGELLITNGLGHHKIFKDNFVIQRIIDFIQ